LIVRHYTAINNLAMLQGWFARPAAIAGGAVGRFHRSDPRVAGGVR
jgi:hypothetical protein